MEHYRVYKLDKAEGRIVKAKDMHAPSDKHAMDQACGDPECPVCEVWRGASKIGTVE